MTIIETDMPSEHFRKIARLIADNNVSEAERYHAETFGNYLKELQREHGACDAMIQAAKSASDHGSSERPVLRFQMDRADRSDLIKKFAYEAAKDSGGVVKVRLLVRKIEAAGHKLETKVPGTMIGNVLFHAPNDWKHVGKGEFKYVGES